MQTRNEPEWSRESLIEDWKEQGEDEPLELVCRRPEPAGEIDCLLTAGLAEPALGFVVDMLNARTVRDTCWCLVLSEALTRKTVIFEYWNYWGHSMMFLLYNYQFLIN